jgi:hypothetical protein
MAFVSIPCTIDMWNSLLLVGNITESLLNIYFVWKFTCDEGGMKYHGMYLIEPRNIDYPFHN